jgi:hypothetical protein
MNSKYGCTVNSFDPFVETLKFKFYRQSNPSLEKSVKVPINSKHTFYKLGITGNETKKELQQIKLGDMLNFNQILDLTESRYKVIDVFKIDIEGPEVGVIASMDMDYFCKYVKQFVVETHKNMPGGLLFKLEKCFYLFHRDHRFMLKRLRGRTGWLTEWQNPGGFLLNLSYFKNEIDLATTLFTRGELYFVNQIFLSSI